MQDTQKKHRGVRDNMLAISDPHDSYPDIKVHKTNMGPTWVLSDTDGPHIGPMNLAIRVL